MCRGFVFCDDFARGTNWDVRTQKFVAADKEGKLYNPGERCFCVVPDNVYRMNHNTIRIEVRFDMTGAWGKVKSRG